MYVKVDSFLQQWPEMESDESKPEGCTTEQSAETQIQVLMYPNVNNTAHKSRLKCPHVWSF